jgi:hypothetical protein
MAELPHVFLSVGAGVPDSCLLSDSSLGLCPIIGFVVPARAVVRHWCGNKEMPLAHALPHTSCRSRPTMSMNPERRRTEYA